MSDRDSLKKRLLVTLPAYYAEAEAGSRPDLTSKESAWEEMRQAAQSGDPELTLEVVVELSRTLPESQFSYLAAGPVEDLIAFHGEWLASRLREAIERSPRLRLVFALAQVDPWVPDVVFDQLRALVPGIGRA